MKKFLAILLSAMLMLSLAVPAMAAEETGSITINDAIENQTYTIYQILDLESYSHTTDENGKVTATGAYAYKAAPAWKAFVESNDIAGKYLNTDSQGYVTWVDKADPVEFAKLAQTYAKTNTISNQGEIEAKSTTVSFTDLDLGYYLVDTTLGTLCSLDTTNPDVVMEEKNEAPTITKKVEEDSNNSWGETNDADINQVVNFKATITVQKGAENYILHDRMSTGLTYKSITSVTVNDIDVDEDYYTVKTTETCGCTFEIVFNNEYIADLAADTEIVVFYSAILNENAFVGLPGNPNEIILQYGDANKPSSTPKAETITYTWDANIVKYTINGETEVKLAGAKFKISTDTDGNDVIKFHKLTTANEYEVCAKAECEKAHVTEITTDDTGAFHIEGLDAGDYYLTELEAPAGYNKLGESQKFTVVAAAKDDSNELKYTPVEAKVLNQSGTELPETGGMGTTIFYAVGGVMVVAAVVLLITKKRMSAEG